MPVDQPAPTVITSSTAPLAATDAGLVAVGFTCRDGDYTLGVGAQETLTSLGVDAFALLDRAKAKGAGGDVLSHEIFDAGAVERVMLVGLGAETTRDYRRAGAAIARVVKERGRAATSIASLADDEQLGAFVEGLVLGAFGFTRKSDQQAPAQSPAVELVDLAGPPREAVVRAAMARAMASWRARTYALTPSNEKGPERLEEWAREAARIADLDITVWDEPKLAADGFGGILAVGSASAYESRFLRLDYTPKKVNRRTPHLVLVGKGITFDSGGISIKPRDAMMSMKRDMTGAGVVIAVLGALRELGVRVKVTGLVAAAENAFGGAAMRPGDVVTHYGGRTSEVGNTDAEGRLVLADALAYADRHIDPTALVDIATLTGAGKMALGTTLGALFANDEQLAAALGAAGAAAGEPVWRLPLSEEYEPLLDNTFADATNAAGGPGAITAALFLQHFAGSSPWAHLDIASVGDSTKDVFEYTLGATGFGARLLLRWITDFRPPDSRSRRDPARNTRIAGKSSAPSACRPQVSRNCQQGKAEAGVVRAP
ncbi:MAG: leucyl aminopeptidase [Nocardioidaceae bacterium]|nr:leucyl aminopeptidase [Nocardioidaceae bacterium]